MLVRLSPLSAALGRASVAICTVMLSLGWAAAVGSAAGGSKEPDGPRWITIHSWRQRDGLPQDSVYALRHTRDGYLWIGTRGGLGRFDGVSFAVFDDRDSTILRENEVQALAEASDGALWIATWGGGVSRLEHGRFTAFTTADGLADNFVLSLDAGAEGRMWVGTYNGLSCVQGGRVTTYPVTDRRGGATGVFALHADDDGSVWIAARSSGLFRWVEGRVAPATVPGIAPDDVVKAIARDREHRLWIATLRGLLCVGSDGTRRRFTTAEGMPTNRFGRVIHFAPDGTGWFSNDGGLVSLRDGRARVVRVDPDSSGPEVVHALDSDAEGNLWVAVAGSGLLQLRQELFRSYTTENGLVGREVNTVFQDSPGHVWVGTSGGLHLHGRDGFRLLPRSGLPAAEPVAALGEDRKGDLWVGTEAGLYRAPVDRAASGSPQCFSPVTCAAMPVIVARGIMADRVGRVWIATEAAGLVKIAGDACTVYTTRDGLAHDTVRGLAEDRAGRIWIGTRAGLNLFEGGHFTTYTRKDGLANDTVEALFLDRDDTLWIGTRRGLSRLSHDRFTTWTVNDGLYANFVQSLVEDDRGSLWMTSGRGPFRVAEDQLAASDNGRLAIDSDAYGLEHGLNNTSCAGGYHPSAFRASDGRIWFATNDGVSVVDPARLSSNAVPPPVHIQAAFIDRQPVDPRAEAVAPPGRGDLEFRYAALSFVAPEKVRFRYRLIGYDEAWVDAGGRRTANYHNLPPARYTFQVVAANNDGLWNETGASLSLRLKPYFHQTRLFYLLCALTVVMAGLALHGLRTRRLHRRQEELERLVDERTATVAERTRQLEANAVELARARDAAEAASRAKSAFLANISHELRTPLNAILGFARLLSRRTDLPRVAYDDVVLIQRSSEHLGTLINQVLDLSKIEAGRATASENGFDLHQMLSDVEDMFALAAEEKGLELRFERRPEVPQFVRCDEVKLRQVLLNLVGNALKFTSRGTVAVGVEALPASAGAPAERRLRFAVRDTGPGIDAAEVDQLFSPFVQAQAGRRAQEGTGLGLAISRSFVALMGGDIRLSSQPGQGTTVTFEIPVRELAAPEGRVSAVPGRRRAAGLAPGQPMRRILVVDDRWAGRQLLLRLLRPLGFQAREASNGEEAVGIAAEWHPDLVWMDVRMPVLDGIAATRIIKSGQGGREMKIIALTASAFEEDRGDILAAGCDDFLRKPVREEDLLAMIEKHLGVVFVYQEESSRSAVPALDPRALATLPEELRARLERALVQLDVPGVQRALSDLRAREPALAEALSALAADFQFERILEAVRAAAGRPATPTR